LNLPGFTIKLNNRKVLSGIAEVCSVSGQLIDLTVALDKLDKIGEDGVINELKNKGFEDSVINLIKPLFALNGTFSERLRTLSAFLKDS